MLDEAGEVADVVQSHRETLLAAQIEALSAGRIEMAHKALDTFVNAVRHSLLWERTNGRLRQYTSFDRVNAWKSELAAHLYGAAAKSTLVDYLVSADEEIAAVDFYAVTLTNGRVITRQDIRDACATELLTGLESDEKVRAAADRPATKNELRRWQRHCRSRWRFPSLPRRGRVNGYRERYCFSHRGHG